MIECVDHYPYLKLIRNDITKGLCEKVLLGLHLVKWLSPLEIDVV